MPIFDVCPPDARHTQARGDENEHTLRGELCPSAAGASIGAMRASVRRMLREHAIPENAVDDAVLVVSELLTNAAVHGSGGAESETTLKLVVDESRLRIEVRDRSPLGPVGRKASEDAENGRGLAVVDALVDRWGWGPIPGGKVVWCEIAGWSEQTAGQRA